MAPCRPLTMTNDRGGGGRTYSGVCAAGQATGNGGLTGKCAASGRADDGQHSPDLKGLWASAEVQEQLKMAAV
jgi:hypothetical protein